MTVAEGSNPDRRPLHAAIMWWGHYSRPWLPAIYVTIEAVLIVSWWGVKLGPAVEILRWTALTTILTALISKQIHDRNLCLRHIQESPLLDPQTAVDDNMRYLWFMHRKHLSWGVVALAALPLLLPVTGRWDLPLYARIALTVLALVGLAATWYFLHASNVHRRLVGWCPWCNPRRGGDDHPAVAPTPDPVGTSNR